MNSLLFRYVGMWQAPLSSCGPRKGCVKTFLKAHWLMCLKKCVNILFMKVLKVTLGNLFLYQERLKQVRKTDWCESQFQPQNHDFGSWSLPGFYCVGCFGARHVSMEFSFSKMHQDPMFLLPFPSAWFKIASLPSASVGSSQLLQRKHINSPLAPPANS